MAAVDRSPDRGRNATGDAPEGSGFRRKGEVGEGATTGIWLVDKGSGRATPGLDMRPGGLSAMVAS